MKTLLLIRHGETAGNGLRRYIGRTDEPLSPAGLEQARALGELGLHADRVFVSPLLRCRQTAALAFPGQPQIIVGGLRETDFGVFEGRSAADMSDDPAYRRWVEGGCLGPIPGGDDPLAFRRRCVDAFLNCMALTPSGAAAALVVHGGVLMAVLAALALPRRSFYESRLPNGSLLNCQYDGRNILFPA